MSGEKIILLLTLAFTTSAVFPGCPTMQCSNTIINSTCYQYTNLGSGVAVASLNSCNSTSYCNVTNVNLPASGNVQCVSISTANPTDLYTGAYCKYYSWCAAASCVKNICGGFDLPSTCDTNYDCDIGLFCEDDSGRCRKLIMGGQSCTQPQSCTYSYDCFNGKCTELLSLSDGSTVTVSGDKIFCKSGFSVALLNEGTIICLNLKSANLHFTRARQILIVWEYELLAA